MSGDEIVIFPFLNMEFDIVLRSCSTGASQYISGQKR